MRPAVEIDADDFIAVKSFKAKGKRLTQYSLASIEDITPEPEQPEESPTEEKAEENFMTETASNDNVEPETEENQDESPRPGVQPSLFDDL